jgi:type IV pilus assembly protein PilM
MRRLVSTAWNGRNRPLIGLDLGSSAIKAVQLAPAGESYTIAASAISPLPAGAIDDGTVVDRQAVVTAIRRVLKHHAFRRARLAVALPTQSVVVRRLTLPPMERGELAEAITWEAEQHIPYPLAETHLQYEVLAPHQATGAELDVLLVAAPRDRVAALLEVVREAGPRVRVIDVGGLALHNAYEAIARTRASDGVALLDIGASSTTVTVAAHGAPTLVRSIGFGGRACTETLRHTLGLPVESAERMKIAAAVDEDPAVVQVLRASAATLVTEVRTTLESARAAAGGRIERLAITGGGSLLGGLAEALTRGLGVLTETFEPPGRVWEPPDAMADVCPRRLAAVAVGLALRRAHEE